MAVHDERTVVLVFRFRGYAKMKSRQLRLPYSIGLHPRVFLLVQLGNRTAISDRSPDPSCAKRLPFGH